MTSTAGLKLLTISDMLKLGIGANFYQSFSMASVSDLPKTTRHEEHVAFAASAIHMIRLVALSASRRRSSV